MLLVNQSPKKRAKFNKVEKNANVRKTYDKNIDIISGNVYNKQNGTKKHIF